MAKPVHGPYRTTLPTNFPVLGGENSKYGDESGNIKCPYCGAIERDDGNITNMPFVYGVLVGMHRDGKILGTLQARTTEGDENSCDLEHVPTEAQGEGWSFDTVGVYVCSECGHFLAVNSL